MEERVIELVGDSSPIIVELPPGSAEWVIGGASLALSWAVIQQVARWYLRLLPWGRRLRSRWFAGSWDEGVEQVARLLLRIDPRFKEHSHQEVVETLKDPVTVAELIRSTNPVDTLGNIVERYSNQQVQSDLGKE